MVNYLIYKISLYSDNKYITPIINYQLSIINYQLPTVIDLHYQAVGLFPQPSQAPQHLSAER